LYFYLLQVVYQPRKWQDLCLNVNMTVYRGNRKKIILQTIPLLILRRLFSFFQFYIINIWHFPLIFIIQNWKLMHCMKKYKDEIVSSCSISILVITEQAMKINLYNSKTCFTRMSFMTIGNKSQQIILPRETILQRKWSYFT
jgi:hypothetical protein